MSDETSSLITQVGNLSRKDMNVISFVFSMMFLGLILCYPSAKLIRGDTPLSSITRFEPPCNYTISKKAKYQFANTVTDKEVKLLYVNISVPGLDQCFECDAVMPMHWAWVSDRDSEVSTFISLQEDYVIWSLSILDFYSGGNIEMLMNVSSNCSERWGELGTMRRIAESLNKMVSEKLSHLKQDFNNSMWCYRSKRNLFSSSKDQFMRNFRFFEQDMATYCYTLNDNARHFIPPTKLYTDIPFALTFITILFSPLVVIYILHFLSNRSPVPWLDWGGSPSDPVPADDSYVYLDFKSPHTFTSIVSSYLPSLPDMLKKVLILLIAPIVIYVKVVIYKIYPHYHFLLKRQIEHDINIGFSSMLFPYDLKSKNFLTFTFGPCCFLLLYHVAGLLLIVIYRYVDINLKSEQENEGASRSQIPFACLHLSSMESNRNNTLSYTFLNVVAENSVERVCSKQFWRDVQKIDRWWQFPFSVLLHIIPILFVYQLVLKLSFSGIAEALATCRCRRICTFILCTLFGILQIVFLFTFVTMILANLEFIALVLTFCYISMITYPAESAGYFLFGVTAFYYFSRCLRDISRTYQHLLLMSVETSKELEKDFRLQHAGRDVPCPEFVRYGHNSWGIPTARFEKLVNKYEPKASTLMKGVLKITVVLCLLGWTLTLLFKLHGTSNLSPLVNLFGAFVIVKLPDLLAILTTDFKSEKEDAIRMIHLKNTIKAFMQEEARAQSSSSDQVSAQISSAIGHSAPAAGMPLPTSSSDTVGVQMENPLVFKSQKSVAVFRHSDPTSDRKGKCVVDTSSTRANDHPAAKSKQRAKNSESVLYERVVVKERPI